MTTIAINALSYTKIVDAAVENFTAQCRSTAGMEVKFAETEPDADSDGLIVRRGKTCYVLMNLFPYNTGHMMVVPYRHIATYDLATDAEVAEIALLTQQAMRTLQQVLKVHGVNIGMNQGEVAGAGIADHLHQHIVPRWRNDANFFPIIAKTKSLPILLEEIRSTLAEGWVLEA
jgi:ATP adenylyltransferase